MTQRGHSQFDAPVQAFASKLSTEITDSDMQLGNRSKFIVAIQIAGSLFAGYAFLTTDRVVDAGALALFAYAAVAAIILLALVSGLLYWSGNKYGYFGSLAVHALQIPLILSQAVAYKLAFGIALFLNIVGSEALVDIFYGGSTILWLQPQPESGSFSFVASVNLYAVFALIYLIRDAKQAQSGQDPLVSTETGRSTQ